MTAETILALFLLLLVLAFLAGEMYGRREASRRHRERRLARRGVS